MNFQERMAQAIARNKLNITTTTNGKPKQQISMTQYQANIIALALTKLKQKKELI